MIDKPRAPLPSGHVPLAEPHLAGNEWRYVKECLDTGWVSSVGSFVDRFEADLARAVGVPHAVAMTSGTAALHVALNVAGVGAGDEVLVSDLTFIAPANAIRYLGAWPVFIDAEPEHWQMDPAAVARFLEEECAWDGETLRDRATGRPVRAILPVHALGHPVDMDPLLALARRYGLAVVEDATESLGATYKGRPVGSLGDAACFSFNGNKLVTTGGGGMLVTRDPERAARARYLSTQAKDDPVEYVHGEVGYNYRLTNVQAAIGVAQLENLGDRVEAKRRIAAAYAQRLAEVPGIEPMKEAPWARSAAWMSAVTVDEASYGLTSRALMRRLAAAGIQTRPLWQPLHQSPAHRASSRPCKVAEALYAAALTLPCSVGLTDEQFERVVRAVEGATVRQGARGRGTP